MTIHGLQLSFVSALTATSLLVAGCGGSEEDEVVDVVKEASAAAKDKDAEKLCELTSEKLKGEFEERTEMGCEEAFRKFADEIAMDAPEEDAVGEARVNGDKATVKVEGEDALELVKEDGDWKLSEGEGDEGKVEDAAKGLAQAAKDEDYGKVCGGLTSDAKKQVEDLGGGDCEETLKKAGRAFTSEIPDPDDLKISKIEVDGNAATAEIDGDEANFAKENGNWKFSP